jgi:SAM-dependent methyltransferase
MRPTAIRMRSALLALALLVLSASGSKSGAQDPAASPSQPQIGQDGKDVVWVPTPERLIERMLQMADTTSKDLVVDLGSGDGRIPIAAAKRFGARGLGIEYDANLVQISINSAAREGVADRVRFLRQDLFQADLSEATVVALYVSPSIMLALRPRLLGLKAGTRVVSHQFALGDWEADEQALVERTTGYLWVVPAKVEGRWKLRLGEDLYDLQLQQDYQMLRGSAEREGKRSPVIAARLRGADIRFAFVDRNGDPRSFSGRMTGDAMEGSSRTHGQPELRWSARRQ